MDINYIYYIIASLIGVYISYVGKYKNYGQIARIFFIYVLGIVIGLIIPIL